MTAVAHKGTSDDPSPLDWAEESAGAEDRPWVLQIPHDPKPRTALAAIVLAGIIFCLSSLLYVYAARAHGGNDQEGYLVTARLIADEHAISFIPTDPYQYMGPNLVVSDSGRVYAKYPIGFPLLAAIARKLGGVDAEYLVNPICFALACLVSFWLFRTITTNFIALLGVFWLACNPVALYLAFDANSHAPTLLCAVVGFWGLLHWWKTRKNWAGFIGGFALGYASIIRYSEFLLVLPVLFAILAAADFRPSRLHRNLAPLLGWGIPVLCMAGICWSVYGAPWRTGYWLDHEQTGFAWKYLWGEPHPIWPRTQGNLETFYTQMNFIGLPFIWPVWIVGMLAMFGRAWRVATLLALWIVPTTLLYLCYYYATTGPDNPLYLRFFLSAFPGMLLCALWVAGRSARAIGPVMPLALGAITAIACVLNLANTLPTIESLMESKLALHILRDQLKTLIPPGRGNVVIADELPTNYLDATGGYYLVDHLLFRQNAFQNFQDRLDHTDNDEPYPVQRSRTLAMMRLIGDARPNGTLVSKSQDQIDEIELAMIQRALDEHKRVAVIVHGGSLDDVFRNFGSLSVQLLSTWRDRPPLPSKDTGVFAIWNEAVHNPYPPANQNDAPWSIYEITRN